MKIIVFAATGAIGRRVVKSALAKGHKVPAFVRTPSRLGLDQTELTLMADDAMDPAAVERAVTGDDAVVVTVGAGPTRKSVIRSQGTMNGIRAMHETGVRRLIVQSMLAVQESWNNLNLFWKRIMFGLLLQPVFRDHRLQESLVRAGGLDWTIVRPSAFTDGPATGSYREALPPFPSAG